MDAPVVLYRKKAELQSEDLAKLCDPKKWMKKNRGVRVFFFSPTASPGQAHCDHSKHHSQSWKAKMDGGTSLEAGTVMHLTDFEVPGEKLHWVVIRWDCGFVKAYSKLDLEDIRVFDIGPAGEGDGGG
jgi:hypothetical protein